MPALTATTVISTLSLQPHPEGGFFAETFRDIPSPNTSSDRPASTLIYYLLNDTAFSALHRLDATEVWHYYGGNAALEVVELEKEGPKVTRLGMGLGRGERPQCVVGKGVWFGARLAKDGDGEGDGKGGDEEKWALVGCTVAPGFLFEKFEMGKRDELLREWPGCEGVVRELTREG